MLPPYATIAWPPETEAGTVKEALHAPDAEETILESIVVLSKRTVILILGSKSVPVIVTVVPTGPLAGDTDTEAASTGIDETVNNARNISKADINNAKRRNFVLVLLIAISPSKIQNQLARNIFFSITYSSVKINAGVCLICMQIAARKK